MIVAYIAYSYALMALVFAYYKIFYESKLRSNFKLWLMSPITLPLFILVKVFYG